MPRHLKAVALLLLCIGSGCERTSVGSDPGVDVTSNSSALRIRDDVNDPGPIIKDRDPRPPPPPPPPPPPTPPQPVVAGMVAFQNTDTVELDMDSGIGVVPANGSCSPSNVDWVGGPMFQSDVRSPEGYKFCLYTARAGSFSVAKLPPAYCVNGLCASIPDYSKPVLASGTHRKAAAISGRWLEPLPHGLLRQGSPASIAAIAAATRRQFHNELRGLSSFPAGSDTATTASVKTTTVKATIIKTATVDSATVNTATVKTTQNWATLAPAQLSLPARVRLHVLDDMDEHGDAVEELIRAAACPTGTACPIEIVRHNVFTSQMPDGTTRGSVAALAARIVQIADQAQGTPSVINMSLGFHPQSAWGATPGTPGIANGQLKIGYMALLAAINYARCKGVAVVSAAGNRDGGGQDGDVPYDGLMFPAAWHATSGWTCGVTTPSTVSAPVLFGASAVRGDGRRVASARPKSDTALVAPGFVTTFSEENPDGHLYWEGSSFASAALSAVAARVWSYMPFETEPVSVMKLVWSSGALTAVPDHVPGLGNTSQRSRRARMCDGVKAALQVACGKTGYGFACPMASSLTCSEPEAQVWPRVASEETEVLRTETSDSGFTMWQEEQGLLPSSGVCGNARAVGATDVWEGASFAAPSDDGSSDVWNPPNPRNAFSCPFAALGNGQAASKECGPQPGSTGCHLCVAYRTAQNTLVFQGSFLSSWSTLTGSPALRLNTYSPTGAFLLQAEPSETIYELGEALDDGSEVTLQLMQDMSGPVDGVEMQFEYTVTDENGETFAISQTIPVIDLN